MNGGRWSVVAATEFTPTPPTEVVPPDVLPVETAVEAAEVIDMRCLGNCNKRHGVIELVIDSTVLFCLFASFSAIAYYESPVFGLFLLRS